jgi:Trk K+ transport system NAD-binding subunit
MVVCGTSTLARRTVEQLVLLGERVVAVVPDDREPRARMVGDRGARLVVGRPDDAGTLVAAGVGRAVSLALLDDDDGDNVRAALAAGDLDPQLRIVVRIFSDQLRIRLGELFPMWMIFSAGEIAAPFFIEAATGDGRSRRLQLAGRELVAGPPAAVDQPLLALARVGRAAGALFPTGPVTEDTVVLGTPALDQHDPPGTGAVRLGLGLLGRLWRAGAAAARRTVAVAQAVADNRLRWSLVAMLGLIAATTVLFHNRIERGWTNSIYLAVETVATIGYGDLDGILDQPGWVQLVVALVTLLGVLVIALFTAGVVDALVADRVARGLGSVVDRPSDHVIVCGLGTVGLRIAEQLRAAGQPVVGVEIDVRPLVRTTGRRIGAPVVDGDATEEEVLRHAGVERARCLVAVTNDGVANLEIGVAARVLRPDLKIVLRLYDRDPAHQVGSRIGLPDTRSMSGLVAPVVAARMVAQQVVAVVPAGSRVVLVADVFVPRGCRFDGVNVADVERLPGVRVIGVATSGGAVTWRPGSTRIVAGGERLLLAASRDGLTASLLATTADAAAR